MHKTADMQHNNKTMVIATLKFKFICSVPEFVSGDVGYVFDAV